VSVDQSVQSQYNCKIPEPVPVYSKCLSLEPVSSKCFSVESKVSHDKVIAPELPIPLSSNDQKMVKCEKVFDQCVNFSDDKIVRMSFPCLNPIQNSLPSTLDSNVVGHMVQSCSSDMCNVNESSSDSPNITSENMNSMIQTIVSEVSNELSSHLENSSESSHEYVSKSVLCNQSVQTIESQNNPFFAAMYAKFQNLSWKSTFL
jgi:hypothetical protein